MRLLHILRSEPDDVTRALVQALAAKGEKSKEVPLFRRPVEYDQLVREIFEADRVICWW